MKHVKHSNYWVVLATVLFAFILALMPMPDWANVWRPAWVAMVLLYWCLALPERVGVGTAWSLGIVLDVLQGTLLGQNAMGLAVIAYICARTHQRVRVFPPLQQALFIGLLLSVHLLLMHWVNGIIGMPAKSWVAWAPVLTSIVLWPWLFIVLRDIRRRGHVS